MPERMRANVFCNTSKQGILRDKPLDASGGQSVKITSPVNLFGTAIADKQWAGVVLALVQVFTNPFSRVWAYKNRPVLLAFTPHHKLAPLQIYVVAVESHQLAYT